MDFADTIIKPDDLVLVTGAGGFIGSQVIEKLLAHGFLNIRCLARPSSNSKKIEGVIARNSNRAKVEVFKGNLLSPTDCAQASKGAAVIYHLAAGRGEKSFPDAFMNSVVTTRNLLEAALANKCLKRFVSVSSFTVYSNQNKSRGAVLDESAAIEEHPELRGEAYCFAKARQDEIVMEYGKKRGLPYVILRPGYVYGPGNEGISGRVGIGTFGVFLHLGGSNPVPLSYVDNCADAIVLAGVKRGVEGEVFNVVDDELPSSRQFLRFYKQNVKSFRSIYVPRFASYLLCWAWEKYSAWSQDQLPPIFNRRRWYAEWRGSRYSNQKLKQRLGWKQVVSTAEGLKRHVNSSREKLAHA